MATSKNDIATNTPSMGDPLVMQTLHAIERHGMLTPGDKVLVGVSGGPDSVAALHVLHALRLQFELRLGVAHLDHGLRPEQAARERALVRTLADRLKVPCHNGKIEALTPKGSLEEQLRNHRYSFFEQVATDHNYTKIALGHHADDNAETVLMRLMRGSGIRGLAGIPPVRDANVIRPLIHARREAIIAYLSRHQLSFARDPSNDDTRFERNKIRHHLIPLLRRHYNANVVQTLNRLAFLCREEEEWLSAQLSPVFAQVIASIQADTLELRVEVLLGAPRAARRRLIRASLEQWQGHLRRLGAEHVEAILDLTAGRGGRRLSLPGKIMGQRTSNHLRFTRLSPPPPGAIGLDPPYCYTIESAQKSPLAVEIAEAQCRLTFAVRAALDPQAWKGDDRVSILLDMDRLRFPLFIRNRRPGDRIQPFGLQGTQKLKALLINQKIPAHHRDRLPLLLSGDTILWAVGVRRGNAAIISATTRHVLQVSVAPTEGSPGMASLNGD